MIFAPKSDSATIPRLKKVIERNEGPTGGAVDCFELVAGARLRFHRMLVDIDGIHPLEDELLAPKTRRDRASAVQRPNVCQNAVLGRAHSMADLLWSPTVADW